MSSATTTTAVTERLSLGNLATNVLALLAAVLIVTTLVLTSRIFPGRFAREGCGAVYVTAIVEDYSLGLFYSGQMNAAEFLGHMRTHLWLFCFHPRQRMATERMCHICFDMKDTRAYLVCSCNVEHQEYWWLQNIGGFGEVEACIRLVLDALGESDAPREDLQNAWITTLRG
ncbi:hypothetical protein DFH07DRAFT_979191 [Mycena maculata]|uniref:Uncharacterized protein n=1 Tax=Mycena maculata TaxID=230809 RepID=A0AAD7K2I4_9AGAR|nr:hypothetical protein DFH07DRAFT_979191 [Mycena maculata]